MSDVLCTYVWFSLTYLPTQKSVWIISLSIFYELTDFEARFQAFFNLKTALFVNAAQICKIPLKLCKHRQMSATAVHFSIAWTRVVTQGWVKISDTTSLDIWKRERKNNLNLVSILHAGTYYLLGYLRMTLIFPTLPLQDVCSGPANTDIKSNRKSRGKYGLLQISLLHLSVK